MRAGAQVGGAADAPKTRPCPPALTGGESLEEGAKVDWLTCTFRPEPGADVAALACNLVRCALGGAMGEDCNGLFGYESAIRFYLPVGGQPVSVGRVDFGGAHHGGRARFELSGAGCSRVLDWDLLGDSLESLTDAVLTRVDLAVDALNGEFSVDDAADWYRAGEFNAGGRMPRHSLVGDWLLEQPKHGRTLEVGRRENGKMLRAYEKGRQLGDQASPWTRFEVELRNNDRDIPFEILTSPDKYFVGAYRCLERLLPVAGERIKTHQKEGEIALEVMTGYASTAYGQLLDVMRVRGLSMDEIFNEISRPGIPRRLERAALGGFLNGPPPGPLN